MRKMKSSVVKLISIALIQVVFLHQRFATCDDEYPYTRYFRNSNLTFLSNDTLLMQINGNTVDFFVIGDQGGIPDPPYYTHMLKKVADLMKSVAAAENTHFQFALGDNFYFDGVTSVDDQRFNTTFESVFDDPNLVHTPWFMALGNHDYRGEKPGNPLAQIEYSQISNRWILPNQFYSIDIELNSELLIKALVIDTQLMCDEGSDEQRYDYMDQVEAKIKEFATTTAPYLLILGHSPIWSAGFKGSSECLLYALRPIIHKYKVSAYFCSDDHTMQHFSDSFLDATVEYVVSGATTFVDERALNINKVSNETLRFFWQTGENQFLNCENCSGAVVYAKADKAFINFRFIDTNGNDIYSFNIFPRQAYVANETTLLSGNDAATSRLGAEFIGFKILMAFSLHLIYAIYYYK